MLNRRSFLATSAAATSAVASGLGSVRAASPNETIGLGFIGMGGRSRVLTQAFGGLPGVKIVGLCDPDEQRLNSTPEKMKEKFEGVARFTDMRKLIEHTDVDAVVIATCNHWHCLAAIWACKAGKDVYVEKPLGHNLWEQEQLVKAARAHKRMVQVGTQQRSAPIQAQIKQLLHEEQIIGKPQRVVVSRVGERKPIGKRTEPLEIPKTVDYNLWLGPALEKPLYRNSLHYDWHWDFNTGNGEMGNWGVHVMDDALNTALRDEEGLPEAVYSAGMRAKWDDASDTPNVQIAYYKGMSLPIAYVMSNITPVNGLHEGADYKGFGTGYTIFCEGGRYEGRRGSGRFVDNDGNVVKELRGGSGSRHQQGFIDAIRTRDQSHLTAEVELGHRSTAWCHYASIAALEGLAGNTANDEELPASWQQQLEGFRNQVTAWDSSAEPTAAGKLAFDASGSMAKLSTDAAKQLIKREYRSPQWESEFEV